jgi:polysaccharide biosynthesis protein PslG
MRPLRGLGWKALAATLAVVLVVLAVYLVVGGGDSGEGSGSAEGPISRESKVFGFNEDPDPRVFALQDSLNMPVRRVSIPWGSVETSRGVWSWGQFDTAYKAMLDAHLRPLIVAGTAPCWAHAESPCNPAAPPAPSFDSAWADYVRRLAARYPEAIGIEVWNEPNISPSFQPVDPARYTALLKEAYGAVKRVDPKMKVISGGLFASDASGSYGMADGQFLAAMYAAGAKGFMDAIGAHPYPIVTGSDGATRYDPAGTEQDLDRLRAVRDAAGASSTPIWITEMGVSTQTVPGSPPGATEAQQADYLIRLVHDAQADSDVPVVLIHRLVDVPAPNTGPFPYVTPPVPGQGGTVESGFGVFRADGKPKPSACALSREFDGSLHC